MKKMKCVLSVMLGLIIALCSSCKYDKNNKNNQKENLPKTGEELPVREPILE